MIRKIGRKNERAGNVNPLKSGVRTGNPQQHWAITRQLRLTDLVGPSGMEEHAQRSFPKKRNTVLLGPVFQPPKCEVCETKLAEICDRLSSDP